MIKIEYPYKGNDELIRHYSDRNMLIKQIETGNEYGEAVDVYPCIYTYEETDIPMEDGEEATVEAPCECD